MSRILFFAPGLILLSMLACARQQSPEIVLLRGKVFTADAKHPWAEGVAIRGDRIVAVGSSDEMNQLAGRATRVVDLEGRLVVPGFNDAHDHMAPDPCVWIVADGTDPPDPSLAAVRDSLRAVVARVPAGTWLRVLIGPKLLAEASARRAALDAIAPEHPVILSAFTGHGWILNSAALEGLGVNDSTPDPLGGRFERLPDRRLTGLLEEYACYNAEPTLTALCSDSTMAAGLRERAVSGAALGITSIQNMCTGLSPARLPSILRSANLPVRLRLIPFPMTTASGLGATEWNITPDSLPAGVEISGTKWILDGTPVERLAVFRQPYSDRRGWYGRINFDPATLRQMLVDAMGAQRQPIFHAVGDSTIALLFKAMTETAPDSAWHRLRPRIEHGEGLAPDLLPSAKRLGIVLVQNPTHFALVPMFRSRYGPERGRWAQPLKSVLAMGIPVALGSDGPQNPFLNIMLAAVDPNHPQEAITVEQAVIAYTRGSAYAEGKEGQKGTLAPGMLADLAVLSQDIFAISPPEIPTTTSVLTMVGGKVVHDTGAIKGVRDEREAGR